VCAPEVKKKFQNCETKKRCTPEKYFVGELCNKTGLSNAVKSVRSVVAQASCRHFWGWVKIKKTAGETPALRKPVAENEFRITALRSGNSRRG
jgi:hypothetical protein